jgi:hypothetical protein
MSDQLNMNEPQRGIEHDEVSESHKQILDKRLAEFELVGDLGDTWENVRERILKQSQSNDVQNKILTRHKS